MKRLGILVAICCCAVITTHAKIKNSQLVQEVKKQEAKYEALYQDLHKHPELSKQEERTSALLAGKLRELGFEVTEKVGGYGIVGLLRNGEGPTIALRTDMDALPIREICQGIAVSNGVPEERMPKIQPLQIASPVINDTPLAEAVSQSMRDILGDERLIEAAPSPVSEDFAYYSQTPEKVRTMIFWLGVANPQQLREAEAAGKLLPQLHNECFAPQFADSWATGVQAMAKALIDLLQ